MPLDNDTRGWIMTCISGVACIIGASIICVDVFVRLIPRWRNFSIAESDAFLSASLSLSFGVMLFSSLYSMLPQSKKYLEHGGFSPPAASYMLISLFLSGVFGIQILSRILHNFIPSHVVDCDHTHDEADEENGTGEMEEHHHENTSTNGASVVKFLTPPQDEDDEDTPLLSRTISITAPEQRTESTPESTLPRSQPENGFVTAPTTRRPSMMPRALTKTLTMLTAGQKANCDETGPCMGFSDPCGQDCFRAVQRRGSLLTGYGNSSSRPAWRSFSDLRFAPPAIESDEEHSESTCPTVNRSRATTNGFPNPALRSRSATHHYHHPPGDHLEPLKHLHQHRHPSISSTTPSKSVGHLEHHHHVPTNAFLSIGLQTSIAIALHKAPEGFITYATNHANPTLGFAVFMALFIHNITEGFAMSLPLYLALGSRTKAIIWSSFLGGASQPLGAGVAALWFKIAKGTGGHGEPSEGVYGGMFAVTAGVMTSVALSLFSESLQLSHNKSACISFAFLGMGILGISFALTAK